MTDQSTLIDDPRDGAEVHLDLGAAVLLGLRTPGATGHRWTLVGTPAHTDVAPSENRSLDPDAPSRAGSASRTVFEITGSTAGSDTLTFELRRPWEPDAIEAVHVRVTVR